MKFKIGILLFLGIFTLINCNNEDNSLKLINQENKILNNEIDRNYKIISKFWNNNKQKYGPWRYRCKEIIQLRDSIMNNKKDVNILNYSINRLREIIKGTGINGNNDYNEFLTINIDTNDEMENTLFINKFLTISNSYISRMIFLSNIKDFRFTCLNIIVKFDKDNEFYKIGDDVTARIFISAMDTTVKTVIKMSNGEYIDSIDNFGRGVYKVKAQKKGINIIEGKYVIKHDYSNQVDSFPFRTYFFVK